MKYCVVLRNCIIYTPLLTYFFFFCNPQNSPFPHLGEWFRVLRALSETVCFPQNHKKADESQLILVSANSHTRGMAAP